MTTITKNWSGLVILVMGGGEGLRLVTALSENNLFRIYINYGEVPFVRMSKYSFDIFWLSNANRDQITVPTTKSSQDVHTPFIALAHELIHVRNKIEGKYPGGKFKDEQFENNRFQYLSTYDMKHILLTLLGICISQTISPNPYTSYGSKLGKIK